MFRPSPCLAPRVWARLPPWLGAAVLVAPTLPSAAAASPPGWPQVLAAFEQRGFQVSVSALPASGAGPRRGDRASNRFAARNSPSAGDPFARDPFPRDPLASSSYPRCAEPNLYGLYLRSRNLIVICPRGNRTLTLMHEGWHAIQHRCLRGVPLLSREQLLRGLSRSDRRDVDAFYGGSAWLREAEARVMAQQPLDPYLAWVGRVCDRPLEPPTPPVPGSGAPGAGGAAVMPGSAASVPADEAVPGPAGRTVN